MTYGTGSWGTGAYGGASASITVAGAVALSTHSVVVRLSSAPAAADSFAVGDALNPRTWTIEQVTSGFPHTVLAVRVHDAPFEFEISVLEAFESHLRLHRVQSTTLLSAGGLPISAPSFADFAGTIETFDPGAKTGARNYDAVDLLNRPSPTDQENLAGTLAISAAGDYETESGPDLTKKLVIRRLVTRKGEFFHLPDYGVGVRLKEPVPGGDIFALKAEVERQARLEPDVDEAFATVTEDARSSIITILLRFTMKVTGQTIEVALASDQRTGNIVEL